jgi:hypothetical protein
MEKNKKRAAAVAAVANYIKSEQETQIAAQMSALPAPPKSPAFGAGAWPLSGRQSQMQMRSMVQMKSFHGAKLR